MHNKNHVNGMQSMETVMKSMLIYNERKTNSFDNKTTDSGHLSMNPALF